MSTGRFVGRALVAGLCVAAATAIAAMLAGNFDDLHARIIATSLGFSVCSALAGAGDTARRRGRHEHRWVGIATIAASALAFVLLLPAVWIDDSADALWEAWGVALLLALCGSHASLVLAFRRPDDSDAVRLLVATSVATASFDTLVGTLALLEVFDDVDDAFARFVAVVLVVMLLSTALPPILRRLATVPSDATGRARPDVRPAAGGAAAPAALAETVDGIAARIDAAESLAQARAEAAALRDLADRVRAVR